MSLSLVALAAGCSSQRGSAESISPDVTVVVLTPTPVVPGISPALGGSTPVVDPSPRPAATLTPVAPPPAVEATATVVPPPPPVPTSRPAPTADGKSRPDHAVDLRVWTDGDSTSYFMSLSFLEIMTAAGAVQTQPAPEYKISSGLMTPRFFDWQAYLTEQMAAYQPDVVVFMVGANDAASGIDPAAYRERVAATMDQLRAPGRYVLWVGQPRMGPQRPDLRETVPVMNAIMAEEAASRPWVIYVDTYALTSDAAGAYAQYLPDERGVVRQMRADDGVHFTTAGGRMLARAVIGALFGFR